MAITISKFHPGHSGSVRKYIVSGIDCIEDAMTAKPIPKVGSHRFVRGVRFALASITAFWKSETSCLVECAYEKVK